MQSARALWAACAAIVVMAAAPGVASAFCGFYVDGAGEKMFADATQVVLMREGTRTVLSMRNDYKGPPEGFAMVVPVPVVLHDGDVKTLDPAVFDHVDQMASPRLVEYWEQDPCRPPLPPNRPRNGGGRSKRAATSRPDKPQDLGVTIEAKFIVGEYQVVILSATDSTGLDTWLRQENYKIPPGMAPLLRPYVEGGWKFFVAKVDPSKVKFEGKRARLSPLRFHYDSEELVLPVRLGLINSAGKQDLIVHLFAPGKRYEVANYPNVFIPTNLEVKDAVRKRFGEFYAALFDRTVKAHPGAVVTEYAWAASTCNPCPGPTLSGQELQVLGGDVLPSRGGNLVLTRMHARYGKADLRDNLVFREATPVIGGREVRTDGKTLETGALASTFNNFQGRFIIRHPWKGPVSCASPRYGVWGGPPRGGNQLPIAAKDLAYVRRGRIKLATMIKGKPDLTRLAQPPAPPAP